MTITQTLLGSNNNSGASPSATGSFVSAAGDTIVVTCHWFAGSGAGTPVAGSVTSTPSKTWTLRNHREATVTGVAQYEWVSDGTTLTAVNFTIPGGGATSGAITVSNWKSNNGGLTYLSGVAATANDTSSPFTTTAAGALSGSCIAGRADFIDTGSNTTWTDPSGYTNIASNGDGSTNNVYGFWAKIGETGTPAIDTAGTWTVSQAVQLFFAYQEPGGATPAPDNGPPTPLPVPDPESWIMGTFGPNDIFTPALITLPVDAPVINNINIGAVLYIGVDSRSGPPTRWPTSISGRFILDQFGARYNLRTMTAWGMSQNLTNAEITQALQGLKDQHFNGVTVPFAGPVVEGGDWTRYQNQAGNSYWTGTAWASSLGTAWSTYDWIMSEALRLGLTVSMSLFGGTGGPGSGTEGAKTDWVAVTNTDMQNAGNAIASRYPVATYPNGIWHLELDFGDLTSDPSGARVQAFFAGVAAVEGSSRPVRWMEPANPSTANSQGWYLAGNFNCSINVGYSYSKNRPDTVESWYTDVVGAPIGDCEPIYDGNTGQSVTGLDLRRQMWSIFLEGGTMTQYGHEDFWPFGKTGLFTEGLTWQQVLTHSHTNYTKYCWDFLDSYITELSWIPEAGVFVTTGQGTTTSKCAAGYSLNYAAAYFPNSRTIVVDTTIIGGTGTVTLKWYDPTAGTFSTIATGEAQNASRSVTHPGNNTNAAGDSDYVLIVSNDVILTPDVTVSAFLPVGVDLRATVSRNTTLASILPIGTDPRATVSRDTTVASLLPAPVDARATVSKNVTVSAPLYVAVDPRAQATLEVTKTGYLPAPVDVRAQATLEVTKAGYLPAPVDVRAAATREVSVASILPTPLDLRALVSKNTTLAALLPVVADVRAQATKEVSVVAYAPVAVTLQLGNAGDSVVNGVLYIGLDVRASATREANVAALLPAPVDLRSTVSRSATVSGLLPLSIDGRALVTRTGQVTARLDVGFDVRALVTKVVQAVGYLPVAIDIRSAQANKPSPGIVIDYYESGNVVTYGESGNVITYMESER